jgi:hypothetical protein
MRINISSTTNLNEQTRQKLPIRSFQYCRKYIQNLMINTTIIAHHHPLYTECNPLKHAFASITIRAAVAAAAFDCC